MPRHTACRPLDYVGVWLNGERRKMNERKRIEFHCVTLSSATLDPPAPSDGDDIHYAQVE